MLFSIVYGIQGLMAVQKIFFYDIRNRSYNKYI